jgi:hypothetical protein
MTISSCACRIAQVMFLLTLTAVPFWVMVTATDGFFGAYSTHIADVRQSGEGVPFMQPYAFRANSSFATYLPALSFAAILEDKDPRDLTSKMHFGGTAFTNGSNVPRDYFLLGAHRVVCDCVCSAPAIACGL